MKIMDSPMDMLMSKVPSGFSKSFDGKGSDGRSNSKMSSVHNASNKEQMHIEEL